MLKKKMEEEKARRMAAELRAARRAERKRRERAEEISAMELPLDFVNSFSDDYRANIHCDSIGDALFVSIDSLGLVDIELYREAKAQADKYDPILIGTSGQIKEYREENAYGEIGDLDHRHISQLVCAFPGTLVNRENEAWSDSAKETVILRGLTRGKGWSKAHKMLVLARNNGTNEVLQIAEK